MEDLAGAGKALRAGPHRSFLQMQPSRGRLPRSPCLHSLPPAHHRGHPAQRDALSAASGRSSCSSACRAGKPSCTRLRPRCFWRCRSCSPHRRGSPAAAAGFGCPHRSARTASGSAGVRRPRSRLRRTAGTSRCGWSAYLSPWLCPMRTPWHIPAGKGCPLQCSP